MGLFGAKKLSIPKFWSDFIVEKKLVSSCIDIPEEKDLSGQGALFEVWAENGIKDELNSVPGLTVSKLGFVPIGFCEFGSGNPYFIQTNDGLDSALYRIDHELTDPKTQKEKIELVLESVKEILEFIE